MTSRPLLMLLDGHSLAYRAFYALPVENFSTVEGRPTNAVYGFVSMLLNTLRDEKPTHLAVAFDVSRETFRSAEFPDYKANRAVSPPEFKPQIPLIQQVLRAMGIPVVTAEGFEADDVIATLARQATHLDMDVLILTGDRDSLQLVDERTTVLYPIKGVSELARLTPAAVEAKYGVRPSQYADFAALRGDPSDNLPGIPGVGEKTAAKWIAQFGDVATLADRADELPGKTGAALREHLASVLLNRRLTQLVTDVVLPVGPADLERGPVDRSEVDALFDELEFRLLRERWIASLPSDGSAGAEASDVDASVIDGSGDLIGRGQLKKWLSGPGPIAAYPLGVRTREGGVCDVLGLVRADAAVAVVIDQMDQHDAGALSAWWSDAASPKQVHDFNTTALILGEAGADPAGVVFDTQLASYVLAPDARGYELDLLSRTRLGRDLPTADAQAADQLAFDAPDAEHRAFPARAGARAIAALADSLAQELGDGPERRLLDELEIPLTRVIIGMERAGIAVDRDELTALEAHFGERVTQAEQSAHESVGRTVNLASPKQLQAVLFDELNMPKTRKTKTGWTTDADSLQSLYAKTEHPFLAHLLAHRDATRLRSTVQGLIASLASDGRIHTTFNQTIAATGRLSSTDPNLQNIPVRTEEGRRIRACFVRGDHYESLMTADYAQIEMRIMAHLSEDSALIAAFHEGEDLHTTMASRVFNVAPPDVDAEMRRRIKAMSYGLAYGLSAFGLSKQLSISTDEANALMEDYFKRFGGVRDYLAGVVEEARSTGYTETIMGRRRHLPDLLSDQRQRRDAAERMALNAPIQGSAADIIKTAMLRVDAALAQASAGSRLLLQVHDELVLEIAPGEHSEVEALVRREMAAAFELSVPLDVSVGVGANWNAAAH